MGLAVYMKIANLLNYILPNIINISTGQYWSKFDRYFKYTGV